MWKTYVHEIKIKKNTYLVMVLLDYLQKLVNRLKCFFTNIAVSPKEGRKCRHRNGCPNDQND